MRPVRFQLRLTHKIAAIGCVGVAGLAAVGLIYQQGTWSQDAARKVAEDTRAISGLTKRISIEMLEARRDEKNFLLRKQDSYVKHHAQLSGAIGRDFDDLKTMVKSAGYADLSDKIGVIHDGFENYGNDFAVLAMVQAKIGFNETIGADRLAAQGGRHHRGRGQRDQRSEADQPSADHAPARKGFHAVARRQIRGRVQEGGGGIQRWC